MAPAGERRCRDEISAPRHFIHPALLLLLAEEPRRGDRLVDSVLRRGFGPVDRPSVDRALSDLSADGPRPTGPRSGAQGPDMIDETLKVDEHSGQVGAGCSSHRPRGRQALGR